MKKILKSTKKRLAQLKCRIHGGKKILILCDSHGGVFEYIHDNQMLLPHYINCEVVGGATAYGLNNDYSVTRSFHKFCQAVRRFSSFDVIGIMLGEVDCCVTLWAVAQKRGVTPTSLIPHAMRGIQRVLVIWTLPKKRWIRQQVWSNPRSLFTSRSIIINRKPRRHSSGVKNYAHAL